MRKCVFVALAALATAAFADITGSVTTEQGDTHKGTVRWSVRDKAYAITTKGGIEIQVKPSEVAEMDIEKPAGYDEAVAKVESGQGKAAVAVLQKIVQEYAHMQWDKTAGGYLARAYIAAGDAAKGLKACEDVIATDPTAAFKGELAPAYWDALLAMGRSAKLESSLEKAAKSGDRYSVGAALIKRGDIILKTKGEGGDAMRQALTDGYLRVVLLYRDVPKLQPEALWKAAKCFDTLGQAGRADAMRSQLKQGFADSPWASR